MQGTKQRKRRRVPTFDYKKAELAPNHSRDAPLKDTATCRPLSLLLWDIQQRRRSRHEEGWNKVAVMLQSCCSKSPRNTVKNNSAGRRSGSCAPLRLPQQVLWQPPPGEEARLRKRCWKQCVLQRCWGPVAVEAQAARLAWSGCCRNDPLLCC